MTEDIDTQALQKTVGALSSQVASLQDVLYKHRHLGYDKSQTLSAGEDSTPVALTDDSSITVDASAGSYFYVTLGGNRTLGNPTRASDGQKFVFEIVQDGTGSRTLSFDTKYAFGATLSSITLSTGANKHDFIGAIYRAAADTFYIVSFAAGY